MSSAFFCEGAYSLFKYFLLAPSPVISLSSPRAWQTFSKAGGGSKLLILPKWVALGKFFINLCSFQLQKVHNFDLVSTLRL